jgi:AAA15 family ATPase/GTPase
LVLIAPDTRFEPFEQFIEEENPLYNIINEMLPQLDTGIAHLGLEDIPFDNVSFPEALKAKLKDDIKEGMTVRLLLELQNERFIINRKDNRISTKKLVTYHPKPDGGEIKFEIRQESDGTQRIIDLLPAFISLSAHNSAKVFIIDEIDRSLHTLLTRQLLEIYLNSCSPKTRSQLLLTTHDVLLMDQKLFRRDEMWIAERNKEGATFLSSFSEYKDIRFDKDIRKSYLHGRLGGIPKILPGHVFSNKDMTE